MTDIKDKVEFLKEHIYLIIVLSAEISPISYGISSKLTSTKLENCQDTIGLLNNQIKVMEREIEKLEIKKNSFKDIVQTSSIKVNFSDLYSPSN